MFPIHISVFLLQSGGGHGAAAEDFEMNSYIDFGSGIGTNSLGFCSEGWADAVTEQLYSSWEGGAGSDESA